MTAIESLFELQVDELLKDLEKKSDELLPWMNGKEAPALRKASLLFSVWLQQRGLGSENGGFGTQEASEVMAVILRDRLRYDHRQLFKATLGLITSKSLISLRKAHKCLAKMTLWSFVRLQREAEITLKCLAANDENCFDHCFIWKLDNALVLYDQIIDIDIPRPGSQKKDSVDVEDILARTTAYYETLKKALGDRVQEISFDFAPSGKVLPSTKSTKTKSGSQKIRLRLVLDAQNASRLQDLGPPADDKEAAAAFRQFWGPKAELRRFKDGSIRESIIWSDSTSEPVTTQIIRYSLERHHEEIVSSRIQDIGDSFWSELPQRNYSRTLAPFDETLKTFRSLEDIVRGLKMPLSIRQISGASAGLRYTSLRMNTTNDPLQVVVQFESSGSWPDDLGAIQQVKIAFLQKLGDLLSQHDHNIQCRVGLGRKDSSIFCRPFLELMLGVTRFHIILYHDRELVLLESKMNETLKERRLAAAEISYHKSTFLQTPAHTQRVRGLCTQYPLLSQSIRLFKAWLSAHMILTHLEEEQVEQLVIKQFEPPAAPWGTPSSLRTAFLRTICKLSKEKWWVDGPSAPKSRMTAARVTALAKAAYSRVLKDDVETLDAKLLFTHSLKDYSFVLELDTSVPSQVMAEYIEEVKAVFGDNLIWFHSSDATVDKLAGLWNPFDQITDQLKGEILHEVARLGGDLIVKLSIQDKA